MSSLFIETVLLGLLETEEAGYQGRGMKTNQNPGPFGIGSLASYECEEQVGEGTYGYVYKARHKKTNEKVALKRQVYPPYCSKELTITYYFLQTHIHQGKLRLSSLCSA